MKPISTTFQKPDQDYILFKFPKSFKYDPNFQRIVSSDLNEQAYLVDDLSNKLFKIQFLKTSNTLMLLQDEQLTAQFTKYTELEEVQPVFFGFDVNIPGYDSPSVSQFPILIATKLQICGYLKQFQLMKFKNQLVFSKTDNELLHAAAVIIAREFYKIELDFLQDRLIMANDEFDFNQLKTKISFVDELTLSRWFHEIDGSSQTYFQFIEKLYSSNQLVQFGGHNSLNPTFNKLRLNPLLVLGDVLSSFVVKNVTFSLKQIKAFLAGLQLPVQFLLGAVSVINIQNLFIQNEDASITLTDRFYLEVIGAGFQKTAANFCVTDFTKPVCEQSHFIHVDQKQVINNVKGAFQLAGLMKIWSGKQLEAYLGVGWNEFFKEEPEVVVGEGFEGKVYSVKNDMEYMK
ncbi:Conserved_hypothetical protein [Hexamita inflata]|uniref:Uncharacterized protein n=1 Tax=Hexamita inflata TaxID=28002 RepID=A0AA86PLR1_9EUKA|nr:Conserved hypothetical protein [Hexamita inflata]